MRRVYAYYNDRQEKNRPLTEKIDWHFPPSGGGRYHGWHDAGIEMFQGHPYHHVVRELLQNALDAGVEGKGGVRVVLSHCMMKRQDIPGCDSLHRALRLCQQEKQALQDNGHHDDQAQTAIAHALATLSKEHVPCLKVEDFGTTGLREGKEWDALTKGEGISIKRHGHAGGSFGIGKNASFVLSDIRTVFYATRYMRLDGTPVSLAQGKSVLMSHKADHADGGGKTQGTGFYGFYEGCEPLRHQDIPPFLRRTETGATTFILALRHEDDWQRHVIATVLANFFYAIHAGFLSVTLEGGESSHERCDITHETLADVFARHRAHAHGAHDDDDMVEAARHYMMAVREGQCVRASLQGLGRCRLWIGKSAVGEGGIGARAPRAVALLRRSGMVITDKQRQVRNRQWTGYPPFAGVFLCEDKEGNRLLRRMENPQHNALEPKRVPQGAQRRACIEALDEMAAWIRETIESHGGLPTMRSFGVEALDAFFLNQDTSPHGPQGPQGPQGKKGEKRQKKKERATTHNHHDHSPTDMARQSPHAVLASIPRLTGLTSGVMGGVIGRAHAPQQGQGGGDRLSHKGTSPIHGALKNVGQFVSKVMASGKTSTAQESRGGKTPPPHVLIDDVRILIEKDDPAQRVVFFTPREDGTMTLRFVACGDSAETWRSVQEVRSVSGASACALRNSHHSDDTPDTKDHVNAIECAVHASQRVRLTVTFSSAFADSEAGDCLAIIAQKKDEDKP
ncbi:MAG: hypothetical protein GDA54_06145 [Alphaproteobacteria bacterium GM7ARS4]|nr:hypothetical protein [Alphaproteobacteria bacterium GM7ARS4]